MNYTEHNAKAWDVIGEGSSEDGRAQFTQMISHEDYLRAKRGFFRFPLTSSKICPGKLVSHPLKEKRFWAWPAAADSRALFFRTRCRCYYYRYISPDSWKTKNWQQKRRLFHNNITVRHGKDSAFDDNSFSPAGTRNRRAH